MTERPLPLTVDGRDCQVEPCLRDSAGECDCPKVRVKATCRCGRPTCPHPAPSILDQQCRFVFDGEGMADDYCGLPKGHGGAHALVPCPDGCMYSFGHQGSCRRQEANEQIEHTQGGTIKCTDCGVSLTAKPGNIDESTLTCACGKTLRWPPTVRASSTDEAWPSIIVDVRFCSECGSRHLNGEQRRCCPDTNVIHPVDYVLVMQRRHRIMGDLIVDALRWADVANPINDNDLRASVCEYLEDIKNA